MKAGKPEINSNTEKLLQKKEQRTGEQYIAPFKKQVPESSKIEEDSIQQSF